MKNLKNFSDLDFSADSDDLKTIRARLQLGDYTVSVVTWLGVERGFSYGTLPSQTFEVAVFDAKGDFVPLSVADDVLGWQSMDQLNYLMAQLQADSATDIQKMKDDTASSTAFGSLIGKFVTGSMFGGGGGLFG